MRTSGVRYVLSSPLNYAAPIVIFLRHYPGSKMQCSTVIVSLLLYMVIQSHSLFNDRVPLILCVWTHSRFNDGGRGACHGAHGSLLEGVILGARQHRLGGEGSHRARVAPGWPRVSRCLSWGLHAYAEVQREVGMTVIQNRLLVPIQRQRTQPLWYLETNKKENREREGKRESYLEL